MIIRPTPDHSALDASRADWRAAAWFGALLVVGLGLTRAAVQSVLQPTSDAGRLIASLVAASAIWLPVPLLVHLALRASSRVLRRWIAIAGIAALLAAIEPAWFFAVLARLANWHPRGGYGINAALRLDTNLLIVGVVVGWLWLRDVQRHRQASAEHASALRARAGETELDVLTMQLQPHFLFNTLNLVSQLAYENTARARRAIANLRRLLDDSVGARRPVITLSEELELLDAYLDIQRDRFGARLEARIAVDADVLGARVPRLLLQPIVENAIRHGLAPRKSGGVVRLRARQVFGTRLLIEVADDGVGLSVGRLREGLGLANARHRLDQLYPGASSVELRNRDGGAVTSMELPFDTNAGQAAWAHAGETTFTPGVDEAELIAMPSPRLRMLTMILGWAIVAAIWTELEAMVPRALHEPVPWGQLVAKNGLNAAVWVALTPLTLWLADALESRDRVSRVASHLIGAVAFTAAHLAATGLLMSMVLHANDENVRAVRFGWAVWDLIAYATLVAIGEALAARSRLRDQAIEAAHARGRLALGRVALLRLHLQPAMLLASIDAIDAALGDPIRCETAIARLGDVLRFLLARAGCEETSLGEELALLDAYSAVLGRDVSNTLMNLDARAALLPTVLLCPLADVLGTGAVRLSASRVDARLVIELAAEHSDGIDDALLASTDRRLAALYAADYRLRLVRRDVRVAIVLELPYRLGETAASHAAPGERAIA